MEETTQDFNQIFEDYHARVLRYLTRLVGEDEAEDLAQVVFTRVSQNLDTFRGESKLSTWIFRIAANAAFDRMRQPSFRQMQRDLPLENPEGDAVEIPTANPGPASRHNHSNSRCIASSAKNATVGYSTICRRITAW